MKLIPGNWKLHRIYEYFYVRCISVSWLTTSWFCMSILDSFPWFFFKKMFVVKNLDILENFESFPPMALNKMTFSLTYWRLGLEAWFVHEKEIMWSGRVTATGDMIIFWKNWKSWKDGNRNGLCYPSKDGSYVPDWTVLVEWRN